MTVVLLLGSLLFILGGAVLFTNGVEWLGKKFNLNEGTVGSVLAAVGTALPETMIPIIAIFFGTGADAHAIGVGAILGAPFMLSTVAMFLAGFSALVFKRRENRRELMVNGTVFKRDLMFFLPFYALALLASFLPYAGKVVVAVVLVGAYIYYLIITITAPAGEENGHELDRCYFAPRHNDPPTVAVVLQVVVALIMIVLGADEFVKGIEMVAKSAGISPLVLSLVIAPIATELPEKFNSIIWIRDQKDTYALGNITGAMVFQSTLIPAFGILFSEWHLDFYAGLSGVLALAAGLLVYLGYSFKKKLSARLLLVNGVLYLIFIYFVVRG